MESSHLMLAPETPDHDQRLKVLLKEFFEQFLLCFFPLWAARFDFTEITWLDKEELHAEALKRIAVSGENDWREWHFHAILAMYGRTSDISPPRYSLA